jgi:transposase
MSERSELPIDGFGNLVLPCQYDDVIRRSSVPDGEHRLLWAVLEDAVRTYVANLKCRTRNQRVAYEEVRNWFFPPSGRRGLFSFESVCELLELDPARVLKGIRSMRIGDLPARRHRGTPRGTRIQQLAA